MRCGKQRDESRLSLSGETETRSGLSLVEDGKDRLEEDVAEDGEAHAGVWLEATEAQRAADWSVVEKRTGDDEWLAANHDSEVWKNGVAREDPATDLAVVLSTWNLGVVVVDDLLWEVEKGSAGVSDGLADALLDKSVVADFVAASVEHPVAAGALNWNVGKSAGVLAGVDVAEVKGTRGTLLKSDGEESGLESALDVGEEGWHLLWVGLVDVVESKAEKTVVGGVCKEGRGDGSGSLDSHGSGSDTTDLNSVRVDVARSARAITVSDLPVLASHEVCWVGLVDIVSLLVVLAHLVGVDPEIARSSVKVKVESLTANSDRCKVALVVGFWNGAGGAGLASCLNSGGRLDLGWSLVGLLELGVGFEHGDGWRSDEGLTNGDLLDAKGSADYRLWRSLCLDWDGSRSGHADKASCNGGGEEGRHCE